MSEPQETALYLVPTPIGNMKDITLRALEVLQSVDVILAEDTRVTGKLCKHFEIKTSLEPFHAHNEHRAIERIMERLQGGQKIAMVSDAGTPGISDPGFLLAREASRLEIPIECLPGATAFVPALVKSGIPCDRFVFEGFIPQKKGRQTKILEMAEEPRTMVFYESPHRIIKCLEQLKEACGSERLISVSRELTKIFEETQSGTIQEVLDYFLHATVKGEFVVVLEGKKDFEKRESSGD